MTSMNDRSRLIYRSLSRKCAQGIFLVRDFPTDQDPHEAIIRSYVKHNYPLRHVIAYLRNRCLLFAYIFIPHFSFSIFDFVSHTIVCYVDYTRISLCIVVQILYCSCIPSSHRFFIYHRHLLFFTLFLLSEYSQELLIVEVTCRVRVHPGHVRDARTLYNIVTP